jgi:nucleoside-diphosphate-sugar epimerase
MQGPFAYAARVDQSCLIVGCGYTGRRLARRLQPRWRVRATARSDRSATELQAAGIEVVRVDLDAALAPGMLEAVIEGAAVAYLAPPPDHGSEDPRLERFLRALGTAQPMALLYMSTTGVYGDTGGAVVSEDAPLLPANDRSRRRVAAEAAVQRWCARRGVRSVTLRVPGIYGPGRLPLDRLRRGEPVLRPQDAGPGNRIHVEDLVTACVAALERPVSGAFNVTDGNPASTAEFLQRTAALAGLAPPTLVALADAPGRISAGMLAFLRESRRVDNRRMRDELGVELRYANLDDGIAASLAGVREASG